ncbi:MAG: AfsR/SARP family transcriptional regulator, partial [Solimonas sp.]
MAARRHLRQHGRELVVALREADGLSGDRGGGLKNRREPQSDRTTLRLLCCNSHRHAAQRERNGEKQGQDLHLRFSHVFDDRFRSIVSGARMAADRGSARGNRHWNGAKRQSRPSSMEKPSPFRIRLLGELQLARSDGRAVVLPASRKTRALLGYLIATGQAHRRERLCDLFWDGPDDPRAELRWSLSKIRSLLTGITEARLLADRERVGIELDNAAVDLLSVRPMLGKDISTMPIDTLKEAASLLRGEFLDGLDLPLCYRYHEWCMAEREAVSRLRLTALGALVERLQDHSSDALVYARALVAADPLSEAGHATVVRLLSREGRNREALAHYEYARRVLEMELGEPPSNELQDAHRALRAKAPVRSPVRESQVPSAPARPPSSTAAFVGRDAERSLIQRFMELRTSKRDVVL